jgi:hypothetical protein
MRFCLSVLACFFLAACDPERIVIAHKQLPADAGGADAAHDAESETDDAESAGDADADAPEEEPEPTDACSSSDDCIDRDHFCARQRCEDARGRCEPRPTVCAPTLQEPVCGCDGLSYFNNCVRRINGVTAATPGECDSQDANTWLCGPPLLGPPCPANARCARLKPAPDPSGLPCELDIVTTPGKCWVMLGAHCPPQPFAGEYVRCGQSSTGGGTPGGGGSHGGGGSFGGGNTGGGSSCVSACQAIQSEEVHIRVELCL